MQVSVLKKALLPDLPSASGMEIIDGVIYIIGDDSPYLYCLDHSLRLINKVELFETVHFETGRIPKKIKPDLETMTQLTIHGNKYILATGSGSSIQRNKGYLIKLPTKYNKKFVVNELDFSSLFNFLKMNEDIVSDSGELNLEASAVTDEYFILFNRANKKGVNTALVFNLEEFIVYLTENHELIPFPKVIPYKLEGINRIPAGFSGAASLDNRIYVTASVEDTDDAIKDGEVLGSFLGIIEANSEGFLKGSSGQTLSALKSVALIKEGDIPYPGKVESLSIYEKENEQEIIALAVTDNDQGGSELLMLEIRL